MPLLFFFQYTYDCKATAFSERLALTNELIRVLQKTIKKQTNLKNQLGTPITKTIKFYTTAN